MWNGHRKGEITQDEGVYLQKGTTVPGVRKWGSRRLKTFRVSTTRGVRVGVYGGTTRDGEQETRRQIPDHHLSSGRVYDGCTVHTRTRTRTYTRTRTHIRTHGHTCVYIYVYNLSIPILRGPMCVATRLVAKSSRVGVRGKRIILGKNLSAFVLRYSEGLGHIRKSFGCEGPTAQIGDGHLRTGLAGPGCKGKDRRVAPMRVASGTRRKYPK